MNRTVDILQVLWDHDALPKHILDRLQAEVRVIELSYDVEFESDFHRDPDYHIVTNPSWAAREATYMVSCYLTAEECTGTNIGKVYRVMKDTERKWQEENHADLYNAHMADRFACEVDRRIDEEKERGWE